MKKNLIVSFVLVIFVEDCLGCFSYNESYNLGLVTTGSSFYQDCSCSLPNYKVQDLKWLDINDQEIPHMIPGTKPKVYTEQNGHHISLQIPSLTKSLSGTYKCVTVVNGQRNTISYQVEAYDPLIFINTNETQYIIKGRDSQIYCEAKGHSETKISWNKGQDTNELIYGEKYESNPKGLLVRNVSNDDEGIYKCKADVMLTGENVDRYIVVEVLTAPTINDLVAIPKNVVVAGEPLTIECKADGFPLPKYLFNKTDGEIPDIANITWRHNLNKLEFNSILPEDRGVYDCIAQNVAGEVRREIHIEVLTPPEITYFENMTAEEGSEVMISCNATGRPRPEIVLSYESDPNDTETSVPHFDTKAGDDIEFYILFSKVTRAQAGYYYCNASNGVDNEDVKSMYLEVIHKPSFKNEKVSLWGWKGKSLNLSCEHESQPASEVEWSFEGSGNEIRSLREKDEIKLHAAWLNKQNSLYIPLNLTRNSYYGYYQCVARNHLGNATKTIVVVEGFTPEVILNATLTDMTATSATFTLEPPSYTGPPIIGYTAEYDKADKFNITDIHENRTWAVDRPYRVTKLEPMTKYYIRFAAINDVGTGPKSEYFGFITPQKSVPEPVSIINRTISDEDPKLMVKAGEDNGDPIDYFALQYCPIAEVIDGEYQYEENTCIEHNIPPTSEIKLNHLEYNTKYRLELVAHNAEGNSTSSVIYFDMPEPHPVAEPLLSAGSIVGISIVVVIICIVLLDLLLFFTRRQGMIASCFLKKNKKTKEDTLRARDKKGLLKDNGEAADETLKRPDNGHKEFEYNKSTGAITGKHSAV